MVRFDLFVKFFKFALSVLFLLGLQAYIFSKYGTVLDVYITQKGYGYVTMGEDCSAWAAIAGLSGTR